MRFCPPSPRSSRRVSPFHWDGVDFTDRTERYLVVAASFRNRKGAEAFVREHAGHLSGVVRPSSHYPGLREGFYVVIADRTRRYCDARDNVGFLRDEGIPATIRLAW